MTVAELLLYSNITTGPD